MARPVMCHVPWSSNSGGERGTFYEFLNISTYRLVQCTKTSKVAWNVWRRESQTCLHLGTLSKKCNLVNLKLWEMGTRSSRKKLLKIHCEHHCFRRQFLAKNYCSSAICLGHNTGERKKYSRAQYSIWSVCSNCSSEKSFWFYAKKLKIYRFTQSELPSCAR